MLPERAVEDTIFEPSEGYGLSAELNVTTQAILRCRFRELLLDRSPATDVLLNRRDFSQPDVAMSSPYEAVPMTPCLEQHPLSHPIPKIEKKFLPVARRSNRKHRETHASKTLSSVGTAFPEIPQVPSTHVSPSRRRKNATRPPATTRSAISRIRRA